MNSRGAGGCGGCGGCGGAAPRDGTGGAAAAGGGGSPTATHVTHSYNLLKLLCHRVLYTSLMFFITIIEKKILLYNFEIPSIFLIKVSSQFKVNSTLNSSEYNCI